MSRRTGNRPGPPPDLSYYAAVDRAVLALPVITVAAVRRVTKLSRSQAGEHLRRMVREGKLRPLPERRPTSVPGVWEPA